MNPLILNEAVQLRKSQQPKKKGKRIVLEIDAPDGKVLEIDALDTDSGDELARRVDDVMAVYKYRSSTSDRFLPEGKQKGDPAPKPLAMGQPKKQPKQAKPSPLDPVNIAGKVAGFAGTVAGNIKPGAAKAAGAAAQDLGTIEGGLSKAGIKGIVPSEAIGNMLSGGDPTMARILKSAADTWDPTQLIGLSKLIAEEVSQKLSTGKVSKGTSKLIADFQKNKLGTIAMFLAGVDDEMKSRIIAGDPAAYEQLVGNIIGGMSQVGAEAGLGAAMAGRRGLAGAAKAAKGAITQADQVDALSGALKGLSRTPEDVSPPLKSSVPETLSAKPTSVLDEVLPPAKPQPKPTVRPLEDGESPLGKPDTGFMYGGTDEVGDLDIVGAAKSGGIGWEGIAPAHAKRLRKLGVTLADLEALDGTSSMANQKASASIDAGLLRLRSGKDSAGNKLPDADLLNVLRTVRNAKTELMASGDYTPRGFTPTPRTGYPMRSVLDEVLEPQNTPANTPPGPVETTSPPAAVATPKLVWDDMVGREYNARYQVQDGGSPVGQVDIAVPDGENIVYVKMVEVLPERRRQGIATSLYNRVAADFPGYEIRTLGDIATEEGQAFRAAWDKSNTRQIPVEPENATAKAGPSNDRQINDPPAQTVTPDAPISKGSLQVDPSTPTSARQATGLANVVQDAEADAGMIASSPRATGTKRGAAQSKGKAAVESGQIDPETLAAEIATGKRTFKDETEVGALMEGKRRLLQQADELGQKIDEAHARGEDATALIGQREAIRTRLNTLIENVQVGKGKWSDVGRSLQEGTTVNEGVFEDVLAEFRRNKPDGKVSDREAEALKELVDQHNATKAQLADVEAELAQLKAAEGAQLIARKGTVGRRTVTQIRAERDLVTESISKSIREALGGPIGIGGGGLENLFEVVPQLAKDLRKLIELYIEEFKVGRLDSEFYVGAKNVIREALADLDDEALAELKIDLASISDDEVNRIFGGIYDVKQSRTKTGIQAQIAELKKQAELYAKIEGAKQGEVLKAGSPPPPASPTVKELRSQLNELLKSMGEDPSMAGVRTRLTNILDDLNKQSQGKFRNIKDTKTRVDPADIKAIREQIASVRRDMRLEDTLADLEEQLATGNFKERNKKVATLTAEQEKLKARVDMRRAEVRRAIDEARPRTLTDKAITVANLPRTVRASADISAPGRQGWILGVANPKAAYKAFGDQMRALMTEEGLIRAQNSITERPNAPLYKKADLYLAPVDGAVNLKEEAFMGADALRRWKRYNPVRASDRAYAAYLNRLRADVFDNMVKALGNEATDADIRDIARYINVASGRGDIGLKGSSDAGKSIANAMPALAMGFWSPRNLASRVQFVTGVPLAQAAKNKATRKLIAREYAKSIIATGGLIGIAKLALERPWDDSPREKLGSVSGDITNSDFGKIRIGDTRIDIMAGVQQPLVLIGRLMTGKVTSPTSGKSSDLRSPKYGQPGPGDLTWRFIKSKANPVFGSAEELYTGRDFVGNEVGTGEALANVIVPLSVKEIYDALTQEGIDKQDALVLLNLFGISTSRFTDKEKKSPN